MNPLLLFALLCPDTAYYQEPITAHIVQTEPAPPGQILPDAWEARGGNAGIVDGGKLSVRTDSIIARIPGPALYLTSGTPISISIGTFDPKFGNVNALPGVSCMIIMKVKPNPTQVQNKFKIQKTVKSNGSPGFPGARLDGRRLK